MEDFYIKFKIISEQNDIKQLNLLYDSVDNIEKQLLMNYSAMFYNLNFIKYLVEEKDMNIYADNDYVFNISCSHNKPNITRYVISLTNGYDYINDALVQYAHNGNIDFVEDMIRMGGDITYKNNEAVNWAAGFGRLEMVKYLLKNGGNIDLDKSIRLAKQNKHIEMITFLETLI